MTDRKLSPADFDKPTFESLQDLEVLVGEVNSFIEATPAGHVDRRFATDGTEEVHRFVVIPRTYDGEGEMQFNASTIEYSGSVDDVILSVTKGLMSYYYEKSKDTEPVLEVTDRTPKVGLPINVNDPAAIVMNSLKQAADFKRLGITNPTEGSIKGLNATTRDVLGRISKLK